MEELYARLEQLQEKLRARQSQLDDGGAGASGGGAERRSQRKRARNTRFDDEFDVVAAARGRKVDSKVDIIDSDSDAEMAEPAELAEPSALPAEGADDAVPLGESDTPIAADAHARGGTAADELPVCGPLAEVRVGLVTVAGGAVKIRLRVALPVVVGPLDPASLLENAVRALRCTSQSAQPLEPGSPRGKPGGRGRSRPVAIADDGSRSGRKRKSGGKSGGKRKRDADRSSRGEGRQARQAATEHEALGGFAPDLSALEPEEVEEAHAALVMSDEDLRQFTEGELKQLRLSTLHLIVGRLGLTMPPGGYPSAEKAARAIKDRLYRDRVKSSGLAGQGQGPGLSKGAKQPAKPRAKPHQPAKPQPASDGGAAEQLAGERMAAKLRDACARIEETRAVAARLGSGGGGGGSGNGGGGRKAAAADRLSERELQRRIEASRAKIRPRGQPGSTGGGSGLGSAALGRAAASGWLSEEALQRDASLSSQAVGGLTLWRLVDVSLCTADAESPALPLRMDELLHPRGRPHAPRDDAHSHAMSGKLLLPAEPSPTLPLTGEQPARILGRGPLVRTSAIREVVLHSLAPPSLRVRTTGGWYDVCQLDADLARAFRLAAGATESAPLDDALLASYGAVPRLARLRPLVPLLAGDAGAALEHACQRTRWLRHVSVRGPDGTVASLGELWAAARSSGAKQALAEFTVTGLLPIEQDFQSESARAGGGAKLGGSSHRAADAGAAAPEEAGPPEASGSAMYALISPAPALAQSGAPRPDSSFAPPGSLPPPSLTGALATAEGSTSAPGASSQQQPELAPPLLDSELGLEARDPPSSHWRLAHYTVTTTSSASAVPTLTPIFKAVREATLALKASSAAAADGGKGKAGAGSGSAGAAWSKVSIVAELELPTGEAVSGPAGLVTVRVSVANVSRISVDWPRFLSPAGLLNASSGPGTTPRQGQAPLVFVRTVSGTVFELAQPSSAQAAVQMAEDASLVAIGEVLRTVSNYDAKVPCLFVASQAAKAVPPALGKIDLVANIDQHRLALKEFKAYSAKLAGGGGGAAGSGAKTASNIDQFVQWLEAERVKKRGVAPQAASAQPQPKVGGTATGSASAALAAAGAASAARPGSAVGLGSSLKVGATGRPATLGGLPPPRKAPSSALASALASSSPRAPGLASSMVIPGVPVIPRLKAKGKAVGGDDGRLAAAFGFARPGGVATPKPSTADAARPAAPDRAALTAPAGAPKKRVVMGLSAPPPAPAVVGEPAAPAAPDALGEGEDLASDAHAGASASNKRGRPLGVKNKPRVMMGVGSTAAGNGSQLGAAVARPVPPAKAHATEASPTALDGVATEGVTPKFVDCGMCAACLDKPRFGGTGVLKQRCVRKDKGRARAHKGAGDTGGGVGADGSAAADGGADDDEDEDAEPLAKMSRTEQQAGGVERTGPAAAQGAPSGPPIATAVRSVPQAVPERTNRLEKGMLHELERAGIPRSFKQIAAALRKEASADADETAEEWEARVHELVASCRDPRVQSGDGLVWLN